MTSIDDFRQMGFLPQALANYMTLLGWTPPDSQEIFSLSEAAVNFNLEKVNSAGAKFDWAKLDWINSQYLHQLPPEELVDLLIPYWQNAGYTIDSQSGRTWLTSLTALIGPSLTRLTDGVKESRLLFGEKLVLDEEAKTFLQQPEAQNIISAVLESLESNPHLDETQAKEIINTLTKTQKVKKGLVMRSLRGGLMGELHGPDLMQSWLLLNQKGWDKFRLQQAVKLSN